MGGDPGRRMGVGPGHLFPLRQIKLIDFFSVFGLVGAKVGGFVRSGQLLVPSPEKNPRPGEFDHFNSSSPSVLMAHGGGSPKGSVVVLSGGAPGAPELPEERA